MTKVYEYSSGLASQIQLFIDEKRALGCKYEKEAKCFYEMDKFLTSQGIQSPVFPQEVVEKWISKRPNEKRKNQRWRLNFTKRFVNYLIINGIDAYYPALTISSRDEADFVPYIFTNEELSRILAYFYSMRESRQYPQCHMVFPLFFKTLVCCGLRAGEAANLCVKDVDIENGILFILNAKHGKSRQVPISKSLHREYIDYFEKVHVSSNGETYFFPNSRGKAHHTNVIYDRFREALWHCGIPHKGRGYGPRVHDLRHTFAVRCMMKLKKIKGDVVTSLPYLSAYLGHYNMNKTQHYLHLIADAYPELLANQEDYLGDTIPTWEVPYDKE